MVTDLLDDCQEPEWLVSNVEAMRYVEYCLWESFRLGVTLHLSGSAPCIWIDTEKILTLTRKALGKLYFH